MKRIIAAGMLLAAWLPAQAVAGETPGAEGSAMSVVIDIALLAAGLACFTLCLRVFSLLKGGELSPGWQMLSVSFLIFSISQVLSLSTALEFLALHRNAIAVLHILAMLLIVLGVARIKKSLT